MTARTTQAGAISTRAFFDKFLRVPDGAGRLVPMTLHPAQLRLLDAYDAVDPVTGLPRHPWVHGDWPKKTGKSTNQGGIGVRELTAGTEPDREVIVVGNDYSQSKDITFAAAARFCRRHPWLAKHTRILSDTIVYRETVGDERTGGRHLQEHIMRAVPARDIRSLHGANPVLVIFDELWGFMNYDAIEALSASPARRMSRVLSSSYKGLRSQMREGFPLFDLLQRWQAGSDPGLFVSTLEGPDAYAGVPWVTSRFLEQQRRIYAAVPAKYQRLFENRWAVGGDGNFLTGEEIADAVDATLTEPERGEPGMAYTVGVDLGLTFDWSAVVVSHVGSDHRLVVDAVRFWRGTRQRPVSVSAIEDEVIALSKRFRIERCVVDQLAGTFPRRTLASTRLARNVHGGCGSGPPGPHGHAAQTRVCSPAHPHSTASGTRRTARNHRRRRAKAPGSGPVHQRQRHRCGQA
ncbi:MAG: hypothetical protein AB7N65_23920 [Vicinamibacterales bacterium]